MVCTLLTAEVAEQTNLMIARFHSAVDVRYQVESIHHIGKDSHIQSAFEKSGPRAARDYPLDLILSNVAADGMKGRIRDLRFVEDAGNHLADVRWKTVQTSVKTFFRRYDH